MDMARHADAVAKTLMGHWYLRANGLVERFHRQLKTWLRFQRNLDTSRQFVFDPAESASNKQDRHKLQSIKNGLRMPTLLT
ncbi:unnamed protein product [Protopolystoma xenopodis]|uniref:Uncharacterized protein n=1 Tax=Protopolystoma xenopodis TaxID=117903 RepID=A0A448WSJ1_9PLAT|nr:unnamed protein product [Protopolystoma xenopodis]